MLLANTEDQSTDKQIGKIKIEQINNDIIRDDTQSNDNLSTKHYEENIDPISVIENVDNVEECNFRENFEGKNNHVKDEVLGIEEYIDGNNISLVPHGKEDELGVAITKKTQIFYLQLRICFKITFESAYFENP